MTPTTRTIADMNAMTTRPTTRRTNPDHQWHVVILCHSVKLIGQHLVKILVIKTHFSPFGFNQVTKLAGLKESWQNPDAGQRYF